REESVLRSKTLDRRHDDVRFLPVIALLFIDDRLDAVVGQIRGEVFPRLRLEFQSVDKKQDARGIFGAQVKLGDRRAEQRLASAGRHFEEESMFARQHGLLKLAERGDLILAEKADLLVDRDLGALGR